MLGLTELDDLVCQWLSPHDLAQCARVSKRWHSIAIPHLWSSKNAEEGFCRIVFENYLAEQRHYKLQKNEESTEQPSQAQPFLPSPSLSKYGHWIRRITSPTNLEPTFRSLSSTVRQGEAPTSHELVLHLLNRCSPQVQVNYLIVDLETLDLNSDNPKRMILDFCLPRLRGLLIQGNEWYPFRVRRLMDIFDLLDRHATALEGLELDIDFSNSETICIPEDQTGDGLKVWTSLRRLSLSKYIDNTDTNAFLPWLLKKCHGVKWVVINDYTGTAERLADMLSHLPNLDEIAFGDNYLSTGYMEDDTMARVLSGSSKGLELVGIGPKTRFGKTTMSALARHFSTLQTLDMDGCESVTSDQLVLVLRSCPHLESLSNVYWHREMSRHPTVNAEAFIDADPDTGSLKPWACEKSLRMLFFKITGVPRPELEGDDVVDETYPGQSRELHGQVYDRLSRLTNLETLWLGDQDNLHQTDCLEMSLESGLDKLSRLTKLKTLDISDMEMSIGVKEVQWMTEYWPRLRTIYGLCRGEKNKEAARWLRENRPYVELLS